MARKSNSGARKKKRPRRVAGPFSPEVGYFSAVRVRSAYQIPFWFAQVDVAFPAVFWSMKSDVSQIVTG